jgi:hypothetical protein
MLDYQIVPSHITELRRRHRRHKSEKRYLCRFCQKRFKNKNEACRHEKSVHLRRYSWSCATLPTVQEAFFSLPFSPTVADMCGYCGEEFSNPANWIARSTHLNQVHRRSECNQAKKFFRPDHFRQHLKYSHAGSSGRWMSILENACMRDEQVQLQYATSMSDSVN